MSRTMLISGGSRGIGRAVAVLAAERGWRVALTYRSDEAAAAGAVAEIEGIGGEALALRADVTREEDVVTAFAAARERFGGLEAVVANAGIVGPSQRLAEMEAARIRAILETNLLGALLVAREGARCLGGREGASMVFVSSAASRHGSPFEYVDYAASKGALDTLTVGLSRELAGDGIRVNAVRPGLIETDIHASGGEPGRAWRLAEGVPMARPGTAGEVARAILWLCGPEASYCTGAILDVGGGR